MPRKAIWALGSVFLLAFILIAASVGAQGGEAKDMNVLQQFDLTDKAYHRNWPLSETLSSGHEQNTRDQDQAIRSSFTRGVGRRQAR